MAGRSEGLSAVEHLGGFFTIIREISLFQRYGSSLSKGVQRLPSLADILRYKRDEKRQC